MVTRRTLTDRQKKLLRCIVKYQKAHGFSPSVRDLCEMTGVRSTSTVHAQLKALEENGYIEDEGVSEDALRKDEGVISVC